MGQIQFFQVIDLLGALVCPVQQPMLLVSFQNLNHQLCIKSINITKQNDKSGSFEIF